MTVLTQSATVTNSVLVPFAGAGILTPAQVYPLTVDANLGTTFTVVTLARIAVDRKWVVAVYLVAGFIVLPAPVIILVGVL